ncbi:MAG: caspase family protein [Bacteroidota bacterium]
MRCLALLLAVLAAPAALAVALPPSAVPDAPTKRALVVAVADYPDASGYSDLNADNDVPLIVQALAAQGFAEDDLVVLQDAAATRDGILDALDALTAASAPGDVVVLHYSGHGVRISDDDGDELDGYDEALAPYDAVTAPLDRATATHLRDDDLGAVLGRLRRTVGPTGSVTVWLDACYSGTATRSDAPQRGHPTPIGPPADADGDGVPDTATPLLDAPSSRTRGAPAADDAALAPIVVLSAAGPNEPNWEYKHFYTEGGRRRAKLYGSLSYALSQALREVEPGETVRAFFDRLAVRMNTLAAQQTPQAEGTLDALLFSGQTVTQTPFYRVRATDDTATDDTATDGATATLDGGTLNGLLADARVAFYPRGTPSPDAADGPALATGRVTQATPTEATVTLDATSDTALDDAWVFVTAPGFGPLELYVEFDPALDAETRADLALVFEDTPALVAVEDGETGGQTGGQVRLAQEGNAFVLTATQSGIPIGDPMLAGPTALRDVQQRLLGYARNAYLKQVELTHDGIDVTLELVPGRFYRDAQSVWRMDTSAVVAKNAGGLWQFTPAAEDAGGTPGFVFRLHNRGDTDAHVALLELYPDGRIEQIAPAVEGGEYLLTAGQTKLLSVEEALGHARIPEAPFGTYVFKLFATEQPIDFTPVLTDLARTRSASPPSGGPLDALMAGAHYGTRSGGLAPPPQTGATATLVMEVVDE